MFSVHDNLAFIFTSPVIILLDTKYLDSSIRVVKIPLVLTKDSNNVTENINPTCKE